MDGVATDNRSLKNIQCHLGIFLPLHEKIFFHWPNVGNNELLKIVDFDLIEDNIKSPFKKYKTLSEVVSDLKWLHHNTSIVDGPGNHPAHDIVWAWLKGSSPWPAKKPKPKLEPAKMYWLVVKTPSSSTKLTGKQQQSWGESVYSLLQSPFHYLMALIPIAIVH
ncbi:hypothetical protein JTE90_021730 [Oedothorax gibbosus]|uniref:Uncharacterized protein n=1 Tax=Oedothorax gibbosus TaxID=931172 RepID=A0AAV6UDM9_9ARAC|nr:hypothetical protein JTE90_021730 [Oedothorax gibbosus]